MLNDFRDTLVAMLKEYPQLKIELGYKQWSTDFLRFYDSQVNYSIVKNTITLGASLYKGKKGYSFSLSNPTIQQVKQTIDEALDLIDALPEDPDFIDLEDDTRLADPRNVTNNIQAVDLKTRVGILNELAKAVEPFGFSIYGTFICNYSNTAIINSNGLHKTMVNSPIMLEVKAVNKQTEVTVLQSWGGEDFSKFNLANFTNDFVKKVKAATSERTDVEADYYTVILAPRCIGELIGMLGWVGFSAGALDRKISCFEGKQGQKMFPEYITLTDNPTAPGVIRMDYDGDGHLYQPTTLIEKGVLSDFMVNNYYGRKLKLTKNGASGECLCLAPGNSSLDEMLASVPNGLYISSLHYMNFINPKETSLTGLTRDGTFLIEDGKMTKVVNNLRFTIKITDILNAISMIENQTHSVPFSDNYDSFAITATVMPHVKVDKFKITSSTRTI